LGFLLTVALLADFLAYSKPIYATLPNGESHWPIFQDYAEALGLYQWPSELRLLDWKTAQLTTAVWPPVRHLPGDIDAQNMDAIGPGAPQELAHSGFRHYLGTDEMGRDVLSGLIHGSRISLTVGLVATGIATLIGIFIGALAGYFGDDRLKLSRARCIGAGLGILAGGFWGFGARSYAFSDALSHSFVLFLLNLLWGLVVLGGLTWGLSRLFAPLEAVNWLKKEIYLPVDQAVARIIEFMISLPVLLVLVTVAALAKPSLLLVMAIIGATGWTGIARFTRAELLKIRKLEYIQAAQAQGFSEPRIIFRHALPNALAPVLVSIAFGVAGAILTESALSFLGIGVPTTTITWGSLLNSARNAPDAWWLALFPGLAIFVTVTCFNLVGEALRDALDPRLRA
jgi:peptide/nickel transport system permease protein